jgi:ethanolamine ammonia-lyase small subunit
MSSEPASRLPKSPPAAIAFDEAAAAALAALRARTPARLLVSRAGLGYRTRTQLELREDHAAAVDAVRAELDLAADFDAEFLARSGMFEVATLAADKADYLQCPQRGRALNAAAKEMLREQCPPGADLQIAIGDGLSAAAVREQVPALLPLLEAGARTRGWSLGRPFAIRYCRVGVLNDIGELLAPQVAVLLIGERPGLATAQSLSAYMAFRPRAGDTDAQRNLISNIHDRGVAPAAAAQRILALADQMLRFETSGVAIKEHLGERALDGSPPRLGPT